MTCCIMLDGSTVSFSGQGLLWSQRPGPSSESTAHYNLCCQSATDSSFMAQGAAGQAEPAAVPQSLAPEPEGQGHECVPGHVQRVQRSHLRLHLLAPGQVADLGAEPHGPAAGVLPKGSPIV